MISYNDESASRRGYNEKCVWWKRDTISDDDDSQLIMARQPVGTFFAKEYTPQTLSSNTVGGVFRVGSTTVTICTQDNVYSIIENDLVRYRDEIWLVETVQFKYLRQNSAQFANVGLGRKMTYLRLRKY